jgi:hypothetical protein
MLSRISPQQFAEWEAEHRIMPWGDDWKQASSAVATLVNEIKRMLNGDVKKSELLPDDYLIPNKNPEETEGEVPSSLRMMRSRIGV